MRPTIMIDGERVSVPLDENDAEARAKQEATSSIEMIEWLGVGGFLGMLVADAVTACAVHMGVRNLGYAIFGPWISVFVGTWLVALRTIEKRRVAALQTYSRALAAHREHERTRSESNRFLAEQPPATPDADDLVEPTAPSETAADVPPAAPRAQSRTTTNCEQCGKWLAGWMPECPFCNPAKEISPEAAQRTEKYFSWTGGCAECNPDFGSSYEFPWQFKEESHLDRLKYSIALGNCRHCDQSILYYWTDVNTARYCWADGWAPISAAEKAELFRLMNEGRPKGLNDALAESARNLVGKHKAITDHPAAAIPHLAGTHPKFRLSQHTLCLLAEPVGETETR